MAGKHKTCIYIF